MVEAGYKLVQRPQREETPLCLVCPHKLLLALGIIYKMKVLKFSLSAMQLQPVFVCREVPAAIQTLKCEESKMWLSLFITRSI